MFFPDPDEVLYKLSKAANVYPPNKYVKDYAFAHVTVIPNLFDYVDRLGDLPEPDQLYQYIMKMYCPDEYKDDSFSEWRAIKLVFDFYREMHSFGLLIRSGLFGFVKYGKALDVNMNVDFLVRLKTFLQENYIGKSGAGVQCMMRSNWRDGDIWEAIKQSRRMRRNAGANEFEGKIYPMTNRNIPCAKKVKGVWLFGEKHIKELREMMFDEKPEEAGVQLDMEETL